MLAVPIVLLIILLIVALGSAWGIYRQHRRLSALDGRLAELKEASVSGAEALAQIREAKENVIRLLAALGELQGRVAGIYNAQQQQDVLLRSLEPSLQLKLSQGLQFLGEGTSQAAASLRAESAARDTQNAARIIERIDAGMRVLNESLAQTRSELTQALQSGSEASAGKLAELRSVTDAKLSELVARTTESAQALNDTARSTLTTLADRLTELKAALDGALRSELGAIREENSAKLETIRQTVDEKLHATLEQRLGESFKLVSDQLDSVHRGLGEMQSLASGVGDLRKVLTNIKTRGTWGEVQLEALLDQVLTADQYAKNVGTRPGSTARVDFAIRLPGRSDDGPVWLPIDAKFPVEDYQRLVEAQERADAMAVEEAARALESRIKIEARSIREKYVAPPHTTEFALLYLPIEGLYAEVLRRIGLVEWVQRECKVVLAGPTTLAALLNSLQMGFRTLAIEKRSAEVWTILGTVKSEFIKFGDALAHTKKKLEEASNSIDNAEKRNRVLTRKLSDVGTLPAGDTAADTQMLLAPVSPSPETPEAALQDE